jgi:minor extracellular serine protease Vpr
VRRLIGLLAAAALVAALVAGAAVAGSGSVSDVGGTTGPTIDTSSAIVQLNGAPLSTYSKTKPPAGKKIDFSSATVKSYRAQLSALRNSFKQWLQANAPAAQIVGQYDISLNAVAVRLNGTPLSTLTTAPQVQSAQYELLYTPQDAVATNDPDLGLIGAPAAWGAGTGANAGKIAGTNQRVKVAIIDTGIDLTHPCFSDAGFPATQQLGDKRFTNNKVIVAKVFNNKLNQSGFTAQAIQDHGTHVAGTVACDYGLNHNTTTVNGVTVSYGVNGVAPAAQLGNYNVFPGNVTNARSEDILNALEAAYEDGMDAANLSLGGNAHGIQDLLTKAIDDLDQADMVVAVAAGNSGPGHFTVESPGSAQGALTAGASTVGHFIGAPFTVNGSTYGAAAGDFATVSTNFTGTLVVVKSGSSLSQACSAIPAITVHPSIALISRGSCTFSTKIRNAQTAGADAVLVVNNVNGDPVAMAQDGTPNQPTVPAYMLSLANRAALMADDGLSATIGSAKQYFQTGNSDFMASFSGQGPTDVDFRVKPDVVAPGVNVLSSIPLSNAGGVCQTATPLVDGCWAFFQGTSMATPHLAGSAAVLIGLHPDWPAWAIRSAIVNTAQEGVLQPFAGTGLVTDPNIVGAGRERLDNAVDAKALLNPVSLSFGPVPSGSGQTMTGTIDVMSVAGPGAYTVAVRSAGPSGAAGVSYAASISGSTITVTMSEAKGATLGDHYATLSVMLGGSEVAHAVLYTLVK